MPRHLDSDTRMHGSGVKDWLYPVKNTTAHRYVQNLSEGISSAVKRYIPNTNLAERSEQLIDALGYANYDAKTAAFLRAHGSEEITSLTVRRAPVGSMIHAALNAISLGQWEQSRQIYGYDKLYHLGLIINGRYITQRLSRVTITMKDADSPGSEFMEVNLKNKANDPAFTIKNLFDTTERRVGKNTFFKYDAFRNNCQNFVLNILKANDLDDFALQEFILQPVERLIQAQPDYLSTVSNTLTNLGQIAGAGKPGASPMGASPAEYALSEDDIRKLCGQIPVLRYPELASMATPDDLFKGKKAAVLLFLTEGDSVGHWLAVLDRPDHYEVFDSFGVAIDGERRWLDKSKLVEFNESSPLLTGLLARGNKPVVHNTTKLQNDDADTCGRWVAARILHANEPLHTFVSLMKGGRGTPDETVTAYTYGLLHK